MRAQAGHHNRHKARIPRSVVLFRKLHFLRQKDGYERGGPAHGSHTNTNVRCAMLSFVVANLNFVLRKIFCEPPPPQKKSQKLPFCVVQLLIFVLCNF